MGSLLGEDLRDLEELGLLPEDSLSGNGQGPITRNVIKREEGSESLGLPWFREMIDGSRLGRIGRNQRGGGVSADGRTRVEWEIVEFGDDLHGSDAGIGTAKRKIGEVGEGSGKDIEMGGGT